ncbi:glutamate decarboxylase 2 [Pyrenophora tritici-repentis Pt-1C-BFP]|uniref:glutamate decarboxylase n=1 Tax=Pyrenophora tritici-repentis (strain Pt-1C-BFP) TaxID=426418 RepID=B2W5Z0_PYRTR|nr:glutamate decarboxylase 2 [Pyrenophora tritici-repentis Pt-1C-BFP]EDU49068.1 glutamate decarboxylase 2 [Pyrenophora tritici-repentis Pt-1C-BFP]
MAGLARHVDTDELVKTLQDHPMHKAGGHANRATSHITPYSSRYAAGVELSKFKIPQDGAPADVVHQLLKDELDLDGRPSLNLASFVGTYMEKEAEQLMIENLSKNMSDADEYPAMMDMHARCVSIIANMWGAQKGEKAIGSATTGSSEAIHLGGLAMKRRWQEKRQAEGKDTSKPNIIMGANAQVALEKFARYFEVEARILPVSEESSYRLDPKLVKENIDENTIGIFVILGSTYTGHYEPVEEISDILDAFEKETGNDIPIHVDAASGGFIAPFTHAKAGKKWNFELPRVKSINTSGHKFGLVYAGGWYRCVSDIHRKKGDLKYEKGKKQYEEGETSADYNAGLPVVAFTLTDDFHKEFPHVKQEAVSNLLRAKQYIIPNYPLPPSEEKTEILRVVVRESLSLDMIDRLVTDICGVTEMLMKTDAVDLAAFQPGASPSIEKQHANKGLKKEHKHKAQRPSSDGVYRTVC